MRRLIVLMDGLPDDARSARLDPTDVHWGTVEELLAQLLEVTSVYASERRLKEPRFVPRPGDQHRVSEAPAAASPDGAARADGLGAATAEMAAWAARNGGIGGQGEQLVRFFAPTPPEPEDWVPDGWVPDPVGVTGDA